MTLLAAYASRGQAGIDVSENENFYANYDAQYIKTYRYWLNTRVYTSRKYTLFHLPKENGGHAVFRPNSKLNFGLGFTHKGFTLNIGFPAPGLNGDFSQRGKTTKLDLQMHLYARKWVLDGFIQRYQGYYNNPRASTTNIGFNSDPNTKVRNIGASYLRVHNYRKFSLRAGAQNDEFQIKSAGSLLYGADFLVGIIRNDSNPIANANLQGLERYNYINYLATVNLGPTIGYGYNYVYQSKLMIGLALTATAAISFYQENKGMMTQGYDSTTIFRGNHLGVAPQMSVRATIGYNTDRWGIFAHYVHHTMGVRAATQNYMAYSTGNYRVNIVYRIKPPRAIKRVLTPLNWFFK